MTPILKRVAAGVTIGAFWAVVLLYVPPMGLFLLLLACSTLCQWEFYKLAEQGGFATCRSIGLALGALWLVTLFAYPAGSGGVRLEPLLLIGAGGLLLVHLLFDPRARRPMESAAITLLGLFYVPFLLSFYVRLAQWDAAGPLILSRGGIFLAFYASLVVKFTDVGGYAAGMICGRHKMFPRISPAKSWEGLAGGLTLAVAFSVGAVLIARSWSVVPVTPLTHMSLPVAAGLGLLLGVVGVLGDLVESMFKRSVNAKDSSGILPFMGGLLDVFDSLLFAPAVLYFLLPIL
jgi:phosphatidate cytidylyltransferase